MNAHLSYGAGRPLLGLLQDLIAALRNLWERVTRPAVPEGGEIDWEDGESS